MTEIEQLVADNKALESALKAVIKFIDPAPPLLPVLTLSGHQISEASALLSEAYRCLWAEHPGKGAA